MNIGPLTAWHFAEMNILRMRPEGVASRVVSMHVALVKPWVEVPGEAGRRDCTRLHTVLQTSELPRDLSSSHDVESLVNG